MYPYLKQEHTWFSLQLKFNLWTIYDFELVWDLVFRILLHINYDSDIFLMYGWYIYIFNILFNFFW